MSCAGGDHWEAEAVLAPDLLRVRRGEETAWFAVVADDGLMTHEITAWAGSTAVKGARAGCDVRAVTVDSRRGLLVPRYEGGLLEDVLRETAGLPPAKALGVLDEALEAVATAPRPAARRTRLAIRALAVETSGRIVVVPGRLRAGPVRTDAAECGELLHLALTGRTWEETGAPLGTTAPGVPAPVRDLVTSLLTGEGPQTGLRALRRRLRELGADPDRGFLPVEAGVDIADAPTATLPRDVVAALRGAPTAHGERAREAVTNRRDRSFRDRAWHPSGPMGLRNRVVALGSAAALVAGGLLVVSALVRDGGGQQPPVADGTARDALSEHRAGTGRSAEDTAEESADARAAAEDPVLAFEALTAARADAVARADRDALAMLTVPGSPAAVADESLELPGCTDCGELELTDTAVAMDLPDGDDSGAALVRTRMRVAGEPWTDVIVELRRHEGVWKVHSTTQG